TVVMGRHGLRGRAPEHTRHNDHGRQHDRDEREGATITGCVLTVVDELGPHVTRHRTPPSSVRSSRSCERRARSLYNGCRTRGRCLPAGCPPPGPSIQLTKSVLPLVTLLVVTP